MESGTSEITELARLIKRRHQDKQTAFGFFLDDQIKSLCEHLRQNLGLTPDEFEKLLDAELAKLKDKTIVAVHGIGEQIAYETVQSVAYAFCNHFNVPPGIPLGRLDASLGNSSPAFTPFRAQTPPDPGLPPHLGFAEVYWANVPRELVNNKYVLEESKKWAKTIAARVGLRVAPAAAAAGVGTSADATTNYRVIQTVLDEIIDTVYVLEFLTSMAKRMGLFEFDLKRLLVDFLGDVQVVADFGRYRKDIVKKFSDIMNEVSGSSEEIYIVAHSEGTVVAVLGLLHALAAPTPPPWTTRVRGLMTIGSPVEVHFLLWPELWNTLPRPAPNANPPIKWRNYLDSGDPIAYELKKTIEWVKGSAWNSYFDFDEYEFSRYPFPGKAHIDYWKDDHVFGHFIQNVVQEPPAKIGRRRRDYSCPPTTKHAAQTFSYSLPYLLLLVVLLAGVYLVYRPVFDVMTQAPATNPAENSPQIAGTEQAPPNFTTVRVANAQLAAAVAETSPQKKEESVDRSTVRIFRDVVGLALLLGGLTVLVRLPRLTLARFWRAAAFVGFIAGACAYAYIATEATREALGRPFQVAELLGLGLSKTGAATVGVIIVAALVAIVCALFSCRCPHWGVRTLPIIGGIAAIILTACMIVKSGSGVSLWPVVLGMGIFLYMWWLFALLFDLVFVWHRYIRHAVGVQVLRQGYKESGTPSSEPDDRTRIIVS